MRRNHNRWFVVTDEEKRDHSRIAYHLAKSTSCYMDAIVAVGSGKVRDQGLRLNDSEAYVANIMLTIAAKKLSMNFLQDTSVVHFLTLEEFWKDMHSEERIRSLQIEMNKQFNRWLIISKNSMETVANLFSELGQHNDAKLVGELVLIYHQWVVKLSITNHGDELASAILPACACADHPQS